MFLKFIQDEGLTCRLTETVVNTVWECYSG